jgi:hypothetical protein
MLTTYEFLREFPRNRQLPRSEEHEHFWGNNTNKHHPDAAEGGPHHSVPWVGDIRMY